MSARHEVDVRFSGEPTLETAITGLLQDPSRDGSAGNGTQILEIGAGQPDLPPAMPGEWHANSPTPELFALVSEWITLDAEMNTRPMSDAELSLKGNRSYELHGLICAFEARCFEDMRMKTAIYRYEGRDARSLAGEPPSMAEAAWLSVVRDIEALGDKQPIRGLGIYDPAYPVIEEGRRLLRAYLDAHHIYEQDPTTIDPRPEWSAAGRALDDYLKGTILETVPLTTGACRELARFAVEYSDAMECQISDGDEKVISRLIAQSPMLDEGIKSTKAGPVFALAKADADALGLSALGIHELSGLYDKLGAARALWGAAMCEPLAVASRSAQGFVVRSHFGSRAEYEDSRAAFLMDRIATEIGNRPAINDQERDNQLALRIQQEIACEGRIQNPALLADIAQAWG
ncbi:hypothetical protein ASF20_14000 [Methylobacterium sp. Leaf88]|nr:hypothetical protein ASF20_14000 [Methylobacterium sp. Leaf88]